MNNRYLLLGFVFWSATAAIGASTETVSPGVIRTEFIFESAPFPSCHAATIAETPSGELVAAWFGGTAERNPDVGIWVARQEGGRWTVPVEVANGVQPDGSRQPTWNPVLFQPPGGDLHLYYKVGPSPGTWWGMVTTSSDGGRSWTAPRRLPAGIDGPVKNKPLVLADGTWIAGGSTESGSWRTHVERSVDRGKTWTRIGPINDGPEIRTIQPTLLLHPGGVLQMLCRSQEGRIAEAWSEDGGLTWTSMKLTSLPNNNSGLDAATLRDGRQLLVYNHSERDEPGMGHKGRGILNVAVSDDGRSWQAALVLDYLDAPEKQFSYPSVIQTRDGLVHVVYTWHRERIKHVVIDPAALVTLPIRDGRWPSPITGGFELPAR